VSAPPVLWRPSGEAIADARVTAYMQRLGRSARPDAASYDELWRWSTDDLEGFWRSIWEEFDVVAATPATAVLSDRRDAELRRAPPAAARRPDRDPSVRRRSAAPRGEPR
jgi:acetoacetyl-CoA synthetase